MYLTLSLVKNKKYVKKFVIDEDLHFDPNTNINLIYKILVFYTIL